MSAQTGREEEEAGGGPFEHTAEECGCGLQPAAYAILMFP